MKDKKKNVFITDNNDEGEKLSQLLKTKGIENVTSNYLGKLVISVDKEKYLEALEVGTEIVFKDVNPFGSICWIDEFDVVKPIGYIPFVYGMLPRMRKGSSIWEYLYEDDACAPDIKNYIKNLKKILNKDVRIKYNGSENAIEIMAAADFSDYDGLLKLCRTYIETSQEKIFDNVYYLDKVGALLNKPNEEKKITDPTDSYLYNSLFFDGLSSPEGNNIARKTESEFDTSKNGFVPRKTYWLREFNINERGLYLRPNYTITIGGQFVASIEKEFIRYWDAKKKREFSLRTPETFAMIDSGLFASKMIFENENSIIIDTNMYVVRGVSGYNYDGKTSYDEYYGKNNHNDSRFDVHIKEYFRIISPNRLLHYSDNSDSFEIFNLPPKFKLSDGIENIGYPTVYEDIEAGNIEKDPDYAVIKELIYQNNTKQKDQTLGLKQG